MNIISPAGTSRPSGRSVLLGVIHTEDTDMRLAGIEKGGYYPYPPHMAEAKVYFFILLAEDSQVAPQSLLWQVEIAKTRISLTLLCL